MTRRERVLYMLLILGQLFLVMAILLFAFESAALDRNCWARLHRALNAQEATGLTEQGVLRADDALYAYLTGDTGALSYDDRVYGAIQPVFHEREISHMADVYALFARGRDIRKLCLCLGILLSATVLFGKGDVRYRLFRALGAASACVLAALLLVCAYVALDFTRAFLWMHALLFENDLWLMDPATDLMIRLLPEPFFVGVARNIGITVLLTLLALVALGWIFGRRRR